MKDTVDILSRTIYVENFPLTTPASLIQRLFSKFGPVKGVDLPTFDSGHPICRGLPKPKAKGYAFVEFASVDDAHKACQFFNDLGYILAAAAVKFKDDQLDKTELMRNTEKSLPATDLLKPIEPESTIDLKQTIITNLEFKKLLLVRVMSKHKFQELSEQFNEKRFQSLVRAAKLLLVSS